MCRSTAKCESTNTANDNRSIPVMKQAACDEKQCDDHETVELNHLATHPLYVEHAGGTKRKLWSKYLVNERSSQAYSIAESKNQSHGATHHQWEIQS